MLHAAILDGVTRPELHDNILEILSWLLKMGADPQQKAPSNANRFDIWKTHRPETTTVTLKCAGHTALSLALALREALMGSGVEFPDECTFLEAVASWSAFGRVCLFFCSPFSESWSAPTPKPEALNLVV